MKNSIIKKFRISLSLQVLILALTCLIWIFCYKLWFTNIPIIFNKADLIGEIFFAINTSIIASAIFYFIVVYLPAKQKHKKIKNTIEARIGKFKFDYILIKQDIYKNKGLEVPENLPEDYAEFIKVCQGIILTDKAPHIYNNPTYYPKDWFEYFEYYFAIESSNISLLQNYWEDIPPEVKTSLENLMTNSFHSGLDTYKTTGFSNKLSDLGGPLYNHLSILKSLPELLKETMIL